MQMGKFDNNESALAAIRLLRAHSPFRFGGTWHVAVLSDGVGYAYRNLRDLQKRASALNPDRTGLTYYTVKFG